MLNATRWIILAAGVGASLLARPAAAAVDGPPPSEVAIPAATGGPSLVRADRPDPGLPGPGPAPSAVDLCAGDEEAVDDEARPGPAGFACRGPGADPARPGAVEARHAAPAPIIAPPCARRFPIRC